jgi:hypothetical protein
MTYSPIFSLRTGWVLGRIVDHVAKPLGEDDLRAAAERLNAAPAPVDMLLFCPNCAEQHIDAPDERTPDWTNPPHRSHLCHRCGHIWRIADVATNGVAAIATTGEHDDYAAPRSSTLLDAALRAELQRLDDRVATLLNPGIVFHIARGYVVGVAAGAGFLAGRGAWPLALLTFAGAVVTGLVARWWRRRPR